MELNYRYSESTVKPESIQFDKTTVYLRKNITEENRHNEDGTITTLWIYEEAKLSHDEFDKYINSKKVEDSNSISNLVNGQAIGDDNQLSIMEAIADLYDLIASKFV